MRNVVPPGPETIYNADPAPPAPDPDLLQVEEDERQFLIGVFWWMCVALLVSAVGTGAADQIVAGSEETNVALWLSWIALGILMLLANWISAKIAVMPGLVATASLLGFAFVNGMIFDLTFRSVAEQSFLPAYLASAALFFGIAVRGKLGNGDLFSKRSLALYAGGGLVFSVFINCLLHSSFALQAGSTSVVLLFLVLILHHLQFLRDLKFEFEDGALKQKAATVGALLLYLDLVLIFITVLQIPGKMLGAASDLEKDVDAERESGLLSKIIFSNSENKK